MADETRLKILANIEQICASCLERMHQCPSEAPSLTLGNATYRWNGKADDRDRRDFTRYVYVLSVIHRLVRTNARMNLRELFYSQVDLFHHQRNSDTIVENIARQLAVERRQLGFVATAKGLCAGEWIVVLFTFETTARSFQAMFNTEICARAS
jgi:DNA topoisomerase VI subunit A